MKWPELITAMDRKAKQTIAQLEEAKVFELRAEPRGMPGSSGRVCH